MSTPASKPKADDDDDINQVRIGLAAAALWLIRSIWIVACTS